jgi:SNF2 family DNA or RNA helicase
MDKGLGKTLTILSIFEDPEVHQNTSGFTVIIFTTERGMGAYLRDIKLFPEWQKKLVLVRGNKQQRKNIWRNSKGARYFVVTYNGFLSDMGARNSKHEVGREVAIPNWVIDGSVDGFVMDEFHRVMRRHKSKMFDVLCDVTKSAQYVIPMSGSAVSKGPHDLWPALYLLDRKNKDFSSYWRYVYTWCEVDETGFGKAIHGAKADRTHLWRQMVAPYLFHRTKAMVGGQVPKTRDFLDIDLEPWQLELHDSLWNNLYAETPDGDFIFAENSLLKLHKVRLALICPKALDPSFGYGAGIEGIVDDAQESELARYIIFTPFKDPIPHIQEYLTSKGVASWALQGGIGLDTQEERLQRWRDYPASADQPAVLVCTVKYGESWEAPQSRYVYFLGEEWDPEENKQAEDRVDRPLVSQEACFIRYARFRNTYHEDMITMLLDKSTNVRLMFKTWGDLRPRIKRN